MSEIVTKVEALATAVGDALNQTNDNIGDLTSLNTTAQDTVVNALNEVLAAIGTPAVINDAGTGTNDLWSADKITAELIAYRDTILNGAGAAFDTLTELNALITDNDTDIAALLTAIGNRVAVDSAQTFTGPQRTQARDNIAAADVALYGADISAADFAATFTTALNA